MNTQLSQNLATWGIPTAVSLIFTIGAGAVLWGQYSTRVSTLEENQRELVRLQSDNIARISVHDTQIAVINQKLDTILIQVSSINAKLDKR